MQVLFALFALGQSHGPMSVDNVSISFVGSALTSG